LSNETLKLRLFRKLIVSNWPPNWGYFTN